MKTRERKEKSKEMHDRNIEETFVLINSLPSVTNSVSFPRTNMIVIYQISAMWNNGNKIINTRPPQVTYQMARIYR